MLANLFLRILDMSKTAGVVILFVLAARLLLKKAPKWISYALWAVVLFRLLCPLAIETPVSIVPEMTPTAQNYQLADEPISPAGAGLAAYRAVGDALNGGLGIQIIRTTETDENGAPRYVTSDWWSVWILFGQYVWLAGVAAMFLHSLVSYAKLRRKLRIAVPLRDNVYAADEIPSPFVIGLFRPKIYLPGGLGENEQAYILLHERHHIKRKDHIWKALAFLALCLHWFNPLVWLAFVLAGKDMEMSCDEAVVREMGDKIRAGYAASLLSFATGRRIIAGTPLGFGEGNAKQRIQNLGKWKQPVLWVVTAAAAAALLLAVCLATDPLDIAPNRTQTLTGLVTAIQTNADGDVAAIVIQTDAGTQTGILLTADTFAFPSDNGSWTPEEMRTAFAAALKPDVLITAVCARGRKTLTVGDGTWAAGSAVGENQTAGGSTPATGNAETANSAAPSAADGLRITAYEAREIRIAGQLVHGAATLPDGTPADLLEDRVWPGHTWQLSDGTELLRVNVPYGPEYSAVGGIDGWDTLNEAAQEQVLAFYRQRGLLYDEQEQLEAVYALYRQLGADFRSGLVEQGVSPSASNGRVLYFLTTVMLPTGRENGNEGYELRFCDAFDRQTGAHIDPWDLFTAPKETVVQALLDAGGITGQPLRAEMEAALWDGHILFFPDGLSVEFAPGTLPSEPYTIGFGADYTPAIRSLLQEWAVPESRG